MLLHWKKTKLKSFRRMKPNTWIQSGRLYSNMLLHSKERSHPQSFLWMEDNIWRKSPDCILIFCFIRRKLKWNLSIEWIKFSNGITRLYSTISFHSQKTELKNFLSNKRIYLNRITRFYSNILFHWKERPHVKSFHRMK